MYIDSLFGCYQIVPLLHLSLADISQVRTSKVSRMILWKCISFAIPSSRWVLLEDRLIKVIAEDGPGCQPDKVFSLACHVPLVAHVLRFESYSSTRIVRNCYR